jgi:hypothetical protein
VTVITIRNSRTTTPDRRTTMDETLRALNGATSVARPLLEGPAKAPWA